MQQEIESPKQPEIDLNDFAAMYGTVAYATPAESAPVEPTPIHSPTRVLERCDAWDGSAEILMLGGAPCRYYSLDDIIREALDRSAPEELTARCAAGCTASAWFVASRARGGVAYPMTKFGAYVDAPTGVTAVAFARLFRFAPHHSAAVIETAIAAGSDLQKKIARMERKQVSRAPAHERPADMLIDPVPAPGNASPPSSPGPAPVSPGPAPASPGPAPASPGPAPASPSEQLITPLAELALGRSNDEAKQSKGKRSKGKRSKGKTGASTKTRGHRTSVVPTPAAQPAVPYSRPRKRAVPISHNTSPPSPPKRQKRGS